MRGRVRHLMVAGAIDSLGLAFGWTVFNLLAVYRHGLAVTALLNVAMFCGVALSAPVASRLTVRLNGKHVLQVMAALEALARVGSLALLYWGVPLPVLFLLVLLMNVTGWVGFAAMRTEISTAGGDAAGMTRYLALTVALEAAGASLAALLPISAAGGVGASWLALAFAGYGLSLLPTVMVASGSTVGARAVVPNATIDPQHRRILGAGALLMVIGSGPTLLFVALAARLHGKESVVGAAIAFAVGSLLAPAATRLLDRAGLVGLAGWPVWCLGMAVAWAAAPWSLAGLWLAQLMSGVCLTGFQGVMDHALAGGARDGRATTALAQASAARAVGSAVAVRLVPAFAAPVPLTGFAVLTGVAGFAAADALVRIVHRLPNRTIQEWPIPVDAVGAD